jgi:hypothetical protein
MQVNSKKELKKIWETVEPYIVIPKYVKLSDVEYSIGWNMTTYILIELNNTPIFFIFDTGGPFIQMFSHKTIPRDIIEVAVAIKNQLTNQVYAKQTKSSKMSKID